MGIRVTVTGTGTIIPEAGRACTSICFETGGVRSLIDCGPGVLDNLAKNDLTPGDIDHLFISHFHPDHTLGLPRLLSAMKNGWGGIEERRMSVIGPEGTVRLFDRFESTWAGLTEGVDLELVEIRGGERIDLGKFGITAARADHGGGEAVSLRVDGGGASFVYTGDTGFTGGLVELAARADLLVSECSYPDEDHPRGHMSLSDVVRLTSLSGASEVVLVHIYPFFERRDISSRIGDELDVPVRVAEDGDIFDLPQRGEAETKGPGLSL